MENLLGKQQFTIGDAQIQVVNGLNLKISGSYGQQWVFTGSFYINPRAKIPINVKSFTITQDPTRPQLVGASNWQDGTKFENLYENFALAASKQDSPFEIDHIVCVRPFFAGIYHYTAIVQDTDGNLQRVSFTQN